MPPKTPELHEFASLAARHVPRPGANRHRQRDEASEQKTCFFFFYNVFFMVFVKFFLFYNVFFLGFISGLSMVAEFFGVCVCLFCWSLE